MKTRPNLNELSTEVFELNKIKGFHEDELSNETLLMLVITELSEAINADRIGKVCDLHESDYTSLLNSFSSRFFEKFIKDTVDDELADSVIRLLDLAGLRKYNVERILLHGASVDCNRVFPENIFKITTEIAYYKWSMEERVNFAIINIEELCKLFNIDLWLHVHLKLEYNKTRPFKHGKSY